MPGADRQGESRNHCAGSEQSALVGAVCLRKHVCGGVMVVVALVVQHLLHYGRSHKCSPRVNAAVIGGQESFGVVRAAAHAATKHQRR
jgi:hypothetical protein